jgi:hypothetical protein
MTLRSNLQVVQQLDQGMQRKAERGEEAEFTRQ